jgi:hypothetical protein
MMGAHARHRGERDRRHRGAERDVHDVIGGQALRSEHEHEDRHHHSAAADAEQAGEEAHGEAGGEVG